MIASREGNTKMNTTTLKKLFGSKILKVLYVIITSAQMLSWKLFSVRTFKKCVRPLRAESQDIIFIFIESAHWVDSI